MNPILPFILDDDKKDSDENHQSDDEEQQVNHNVNVPSERNDAEMQHHYQPHSPSASESTMTMTTTTNEEFDSKHRPTTSITKKTNADLSSSLTVSSVSTPPRTHLSRQNIRECLQQEPGAFNVTPTRVSRVLARRNRRGRNGNEDEEESDDLESNFSSNECASERENHTNNQDTESPGLIEAELVTVSLSGESEQGKPIQRAELVDPLDTSWIKEQLEAQRKQEQIQGCLYCRERFGMKSIIIFILVTMLLLVSIIIFLSYYDIQSTEKASDANGTNSTREGPPAPKNACTRNQINRLCYNLTAKIQKNNPNITEATASLCVNVETLKSQLYDKYRCNHSSVEYWCSNEKPEKDFDSAIDCGNVTGSNVCPPLGQSLDTICNNIQQFIHNLGNASFDSVYSKVDAWNITEFCLEADKICELWDDIHGDSGVPT